MKKLLLILIFFISIQVSGQMHQWQMDTFKDADKARKWRSKKKTSKLWTRSPKRKIPWRQARKFTYGQPTTIRHKGRR